MSVRSCDLLWFCFKHLFINFHWLVGSFYSTMCNCNESDSWVAKKWFHYYDSMFYHAPGFCFLFLLCLILFCWLSDLESVVISAPKPKEKPPLSVVGDVGGRIAIIVVSRVELEG